MPETTSTALPSFSHDQHHDTDAAKRKGGGSYTECIGLKVTHFEPFDTLSYFTVNYDRLVPEIKALIELTN